MNRIVRGLRNQAGTLVFRILLVFSCVFLPIVIGSLFVYQTAKNMSLQRNIQMLEMETEYIVNIVDRMLNNISLYKAEMIITDEISFMINTYNLFGTYQRGSNVLQVMNHTERIIFHNNWIASIRIHMPEIHRSIISDEVGTRFVPLSDEHEVLEVLRDDSFFFFPVLDNRFCIVSSYPMRRHNPLYYVVMEVDFDNFKDLLSPSYVNKIDGFFLLSKDGQILFRSSDVRRDAKLATYFEDELYQYQIDANNTRFNDDYFLKRTTFFNGQLSLLVIAPKISLLEGTELLQYIFYSLIIAVILVMAMFIFFIIRYVKKPIELLVMECHQVGNSDMQMNAELEEGKEFTLLRKSIESMLARISLLKDEKNQQALSVRQMELKELYAQVNPHFLHNSLLNLRAMVQLDDNEGAIEMIDKLAKYYDYIARFGRDTVYLYEEYDFVQLYIFIQNIRFGDRLHSEMLPLAAELRMKPMIYFALQTLVENAYKYGASTNTRGGQIRVSAHALSNAYEVWVEDNGTTVSDEMIHDWSERILRQEMDGTGLVNVALRICMNFGEQSMLRLSRSDLGGLRAVIHIREFIT